MNQLPEGNAIVYCEGAFGTPNGKTAHGLVRFTERYRVLAVIDSVHAGHTVSDVLDDVTARIPIVRTLAEALALSPDGQEATHFVVGLAPDGGRLTPSARADVANAIEAGLHVDAGLHDYLSEDPELAALAVSHRVKLRDVRKPPPRSELHFFDGKIEQVQSARVAVLGTDSAVGKRTTAVKLVQALRRAKLSAELIGTGQTSWMQGVRYGIVLDSLINDFVTGEIEHVVWKAWKETGADVLVLEGQGSLMNPAYPGGFELLAAGRPHAVVLQHAPTRRDYDGFPGYPIDSLPKQIQAVELVSKRPVVAVTLNHEGIPEQDIDAACRRITSQTDLPCFDVLRDGAAALVEALRPVLFPRKG